MTPVLADEENVTISGFRREVHVVAARGSFNSEPLVQTFCDLVVRASATKPTPKPTTCTPCLDASTAPAETKGLVHS